MHADGYVSRWQPEFLNRRRQNDAAAADGDRGSNSLQKGFAGAWMPGNVVAPAFLNGCLLNKRRPARKPSKVSSH